MVPQVDLKLVHFLQLIAISMPDDYDNYYVSEIYVFKRDHFNKIQSNLAYA